MKRLTFGEALAGIAGLGLLVSLFLPWYEEMGSSKSALESFSLVLPFLIVTALLAVALLVTTVWQSSQAYPVFAEVWATVVGTLTLVIVAIRLLNPPGDNDVVSLRIGAWLGLLCVAGVVAGAIASLRAETRPDTVT